MTNYAWYVPGLVAVMSPGKVFIYSNAAMYTHIASPLLPFPEPLTLYHFYSRQGGGGGGGGGRGALSDPTLVFGEQSGASFATKADEHKVVIRGLTEVQVTSATQMRQFLDKGQSNYIHLCMSYCIMLCCCIPEHTDCVFQQYKRWEAKAVEKEPTDKMATQGPPDKNRSVQSMQQIIKLLCYDESTKH